MITGMLRTEDSLIRLVIIISFTNSLHCETLERVAVALPSKNDRFKVERYRPNSKWNKNKESNLNSIVRFRIFLRSKSVKEYF